MRCRYLDDAAMVPAAGTDASSHFLTVGTSCGNSARCGLRACTWGVFVPQVPSATVVTSHCHAMIPAEPEFPCNHSPAPWLDRVTFNHGDPYDSPEPESSVSR